MSVYAAWFQHLHEQGIISEATRYTFTEYLGEGKYPQAVKNQVRQFAHRMRYENPEAWVVFRAKRRLLGQQGDL